MQIPDNSAFCPGCGNKIEAAPVAPVYPVAPAPQQPQKKNAGVIIAVIAIVVLIATAAVLYFCTDLFGGNDTKKDKKKDEPSTSQTDPSDPTDTETSLSGVIPGPTDAFTTTTATGTTGTTAATLPSVNVNDIEAITKRFVQAYEFDDYNVQKQLMLHDLQADLRDQVLEDFDTEEAFFAQQSQRYGVTIDSWNDVFTTIHNATLTEADEYFGAYTLGYDITESRWLTDGELSNFMSNYVECYGDYVDSYTLNAIDSAYLVTLNFSINGELNTYSYVYEVYLVECEGQWMVADYFFPEDE